MNRRFSMKSALLVVSLAYLASCSRSHAPQVQVGARSVKELRAGCVALEQFAKDLQTQRPENDFQRFAAAPYNYTFQARETGNSFVFTFTIMPFHGRPVLDGVSTYEVAKSDMKIVNVHLR